MESQDPSHATKPSPLPQNFDPPPVESGAGQNRAIPLDGLRVHDGASQDMQQNVPTVNIIEPSPVVPQQLPGPPPGPPPTGPSQVHTQPPVAELPASQHEDPDALPQPPPTSQTYDQARPTLPTRPSVGGRQRSFGTALPSTAGFAPPPQRQKIDYGDDDPSNPVHYVRDPTKLIGYLVPFPVPTLANAPSSAVPSRFLVYTPPPPPLHKPAEHEKEGMLHKVQRRWEKEVRDAKTSEAKTTSWAGVRSKLTKTVNTGMSYTTSSSLDFLGRVNPTHALPDRSRTPSPDPAHFREGDAESPTTKKTVPVAEIVLIYPPSYKSSPEAMRQEFVDTMMRTKSKAYRDSVIATGLLPIGYGIDFLAGPIGGLGEIDTVWLYNSVRGAKTARSVTKRLTSSVTTDDVHDDKDRLTLTFTPSQRIEILKRYLDAECQKVDSKLFPGYVSPPTESDVLAAIGWASYHGESRNWEDEQWEVSEVKDDLRIVMRKAAKEWRSWCRNFEKNPEKNIAK